MSATRDSPEKKPPSGGRARSRAYTARRATAIVTYRPRARLKHRVEALDAELLSRGSYERHDGLSDKVGRVVMQSVGAVVNENELPT